MIRYIFTGEERGAFGLYFVPRVVTHVSIHESVKIIPELLFNEHPNIVELICHDGVEKIEAFAFCGCLRLRRVIMRGVKVAESHAFSGCDALEYVECPKLERIGEGTFRLCKSLSNIDLKSVKIVEKLAFHYCVALAEAKFGKNLESLGEAAFFQCSSLERITIPLKNDLFTDDDVFQECANLRRADLVEIAVLHDTVAALLLEEWRNDMNAELDSINQILPNAAAGEYEDEDYDIDDAGEKTIAIRGWISRVLHKIINYKSHHCQLLTEVASSLQLALPNDIVTNHVVPFLELPLHTFDEEDEEENIDDSDDGSEYTSEDTGEEEDVSADGGDDEEQQQQDDGGGRKRRKTANDYDTERVDD